MRTVYDVISVMVSNANLAANAQMHSWDQPKIKALGKGWPAPKVWGGIRHQDFRVPVSVLLLRATGSENVR